MVEFSLGAFATFPAEQQIIGSKTKEPIIVTHVMLNFHFMKENITVEIAVKYFVPNVANTKVKYHDYAS